MDSTCPNFGDFSFSCFGFIMQTDRQTDTDRITDTAKRISYATVVGVSKNENKHEAHEDNNIIHCES